MRAEDLFAAIGGVDDDLIERCEHRRSAVWLRWGALAACLVLVTGLGLGMLGYGPFALRAGSTGGSSGSGLSGGSAPGAASGQDVPSLSGDAAPGGVSGEGAPSFGAQTGGDVIPMDPSAEDPAAAGSTWPLAIEFTAEYIRTDGYVEGASYPKTAWITSAAELSAYYETNRETYQLDASGFSDVPERYDEGYFESHDLILVVLEEPSGSVRHEVRAVRVTPSGLDRVEYFVQPVIQRTVPEVGTCDMAQWHILIGISKDYGSGHSQLQAPELTDKR